ncbi:hypothetical protein ACLOJK_015968 [Asimina triloba]
MTHDFVRQEVLQMLQNALEGSEGSGAFAAYSEAFRIIMRVGVGDKSSNVRIVAARCLKTFANIGGPGLGAPELENSASYCVKALEDPISAVRDGFAEALGALLALGMNPEAQAMRLKYLHPDTELQSFALQAMEMLQGDCSVDAHALACVLYILRIGVTDQMTEPTQRSFLVVLGRQLESPYSNPSTKVAVLRTLCYLLTTVGEVRHDESINGKKIEEREKFPQKKDEIEEQKEKDSLKMKQILEWGKVPSEFREVLDNTVVASLSHSSLLIKDPNYLGRGSEVRLEAALTMRVLAEVDPTCVGGLVSYGVATLQALRESATNEKASLVVYRISDVYAYQRKEVIFENLSTLTKVESCPLDVLHTSRIKWMLISFHEEEYPYVGDACLGNSLTAFIIEESIEISVAGDLKLRKITWVGKKYMPEDYPEVLRSVLKLTLLLGYFHKGDRFKVELDSLHGQAIVLAALASISPRLRLGYPARFLFCLAIIVVDMVHDIMRVLHVDPIWNRIHVTESGQI